MTNSESIDNNSGEANRLVSLLDEVIASTEHPGETDSVPKLSQLIQEVISLWEKADTEEKRVNLLNIFDLAHRTLLPALEESDLKQRVEDAQSEIYNSFIVSECLIGENVSINRLDRVTRREIAANRMTKEHSLRSTADQGLAAPHLSEDELLEMVAVKKHAATASQPPNPVETIAEASSFVKKIRSAFKLFAN
ncbi:MAG: hypothetical protein IPM58_07325 [Nitrospira sp.]|nr:hypothetical protein [Nitrospira sp.]